VRPAVHVQHARDHSPPLTSSFIVAKQRRTRTFTSYLEDSRFESQKRDRLCRLKIRVIECRSGPLAHSCFTAHRILSGSHRTTARRQNVNFNLALMLRSPMISIGTPDFTCCVKPCTLPTEYICVFIIIFINIYLFIYLNANGFLPGGSCTTIRHNKHITQHNTPHSNKAQRTKLHTHTHTHTHTQ
jgi:hypothetical protein